MNLPPISERLKCALNYIERGDTVADIGTDHAYLPIYLVKCGICNTVYACDINEGPCDRARENLAVCSVSPDSVRVSRRDGICGLSGCGINKFIIFGMGGELIAYILGCEELPIGTRFILNPMTKQEELREYLYKNDYTILDDDTVFSDKKYYQIIYAEKTGHAHKLPDRLTLKFGKYNLEKNTEIFREYLEKTQKELKYAQGARAAAGLTSPDDGLISAIDEYLKNN